MTRNEEYQALLQELETTPAALDGAVERALRRRKRDRRLRLFGVPAGSLAACFAAFVLLVNLFPPFARACGNVPVLRALAQAVAWSPSLSAAVANDYVQPIGQSQTVNGITATVEYVIVDQKQVHIFFTLKGEGYESLSAELPEFTPWQRCSVLEGDFLQPPGTLLRFTLDYQDNDVPEGFTITLGADSSVWDALEKDTAPPDNSILATFTFDLKFDPTYTASGEIIPVNSAFQLDGQTLTVTEAEVYPTHVRVNVEGAAANTAWLKSLDFYLENEDGERFEPISNGVTASGDPDTPAMNSFRLESPYFADSAHLTLHITGATWLDKDMERIRVDLKSGTADQMPEGVELYSAERSGDGWRIEFRARNREENHFHQLFYSTYYAPDGTEYDQQATSVTAPEDGYFYRQMVLRDYPWDEVWLCPAYSRTTTAETPVIIPIK